MRTLRDALYGQAIGDALGVPYEFLTRDTFSCQDMVGGGAHGQLPGTFSDDTSMALAACDSIRRCGGFDAADTLAAFRAWINDGEYSPDHVAFDYGNTCARALSSGQGCTGRLSNGNGSLMRIIPMAFLADCTDEQVRASSAITHADHVSCDTCVLFVHLARLLAQGMPARDAVSQIATMVPDDLHVRVDGIWDEDRDDIRSSGFVIHTFEAALWCLTTTSSFEQCVRAAVDLADDSDTTGAVAGALAGVTYGMEAIPQQWMGALRGRDLIEDCLF